jgi:transcriptional regulator with XRE-family HTH domain
MTYEEFIVELRTAGISGREVARLLALNENTIANYKRGGVVPSNLAVIAVLIRVLEQNGIPYRDQILSLQLKPNARRGRSISAAPTT